MKTLSSLKAKELRIAGYIVKAAAFAKYIEEKANNYARSAIEGLWVELAKQKVAREARLAVLALEAKRIEAEIEEINTAHAKHTETLSQL